VDTPHREHGALEFREGGIDLRREAVLQYEASLHLAGDDGEEFRGARVGVGGVDAAGGHEAHGGGDGEVD